MTSRNANLTATIAAFARPETHSFLVIKNPALEGYTPYVAPIVNPETGETGEFASNLGLMHPDKSVTPIDLGILLSFTGRAAIMPFAAPKSDEHTYSFASQGLSTTESRVETAVRAESSRQLAAIEQLNAQGVQAAVDPLALANAADRAARQAGGGSYGLMFEQAIQLYDGRVCVPFIPLKVLLQAVYQAYGQAIPFVHDQTNKHITSAHPLVELTVEAIQERGIPGNIGLYLGFPIKADGTPFTTTERIADKWVSWQSLAETLSLIIAQPSSNGGTLATSYIRPATLIAMLWDTNVELVANPVPVVSRTSIGLTPARTVAAASFAKKA